MPPPVTTTVPPLSPDPAALQPAVRPDPLGRFGPYGGRYVPENLIPALERLETPAGTKAAAVAPPAPRASADSLTVTDARLAP